MTDINLLHDREAGEQAKEEAEKRNRERRIVELTNPRKEPGQESTVQPGTGITGFFKRLFGGSHKEPGAGAGKAKILHEKRIKPADDKTPSTRPAQHITEKYAKSSGEETLDDVFAAPPTKTAAPERPEAPAPRVTPPPPVAPPPIQPPTPATPATNEPKESDGESGQFLGVNLVPEEMLSGAGKQNRFAVLGLVGLMSVIVVTLFYVGLSIFQSRIGSEIEAKEAEIVDLDLQISSLNATKREAIDFYANTEQVLSLLNGHIYWTNLFAALEANTIQTVVVRSMAADQAGHLTLTLSGLDYRSVAQQLIAFEAADDFVQTVTINAAAASSGNEETGGNVEFSATITLTPGVFARTPAGLPQNGAPGETPVLQP